MHVKRGSNMGLLSGVFGEQRGDEGKGRIVDMLAAEHDIVARFNGGSNAGHTVVLPDGTELALHIVPSGIARDDAVNVIGNGTVVDPIRFAAEVAGIESAGITVTPDKLKISSSAHLVLPHYRYLDEMRELGKTAQGTTRAGIADAYAAKARREGIRAERILGDHQNLIDIVAAGLEPIPALRKKNGLEPNDISADIAAFTEAITLLKPFITDTAVYLNKALKDGAKVLTEGAQAFLLDIDHGMYPFVTSSTTTSGGVATGLGIPPQTFNRVIGVVKAVQSHVGGGPFVSEIHDEKILGQLHGDLTTVDAEKGTTTGRIRRLGYLDVAGIRRAHMINGTTEMALTKLDWVPRFGKTIKICTAYEYRGETLEMAPDSAWALEKCTPVYSELPAWDEDISGIREFDELPANAQQYVLTIEKWTGTPITYIGVGPRRDQIIIRK